MPKKSNNDVSQTAAAIEIIQTLMNKQEIKDNEIVFNYLAEKEPILKNQLVQLCLLHGKPSKKE